MKHYMRYSFTIYKSKSRTKWKRIKFLRILNNLLSEKKLWSFNGYINEGRVIHMMLKMKKTALIFFLVLLSGCSIDKEKNHFTPSSFIDKQVYLEKDDGWVSYLYIEVEKIDKNVIEVKNNYDLNKIIGVYYDCVNLKYDHLNGYYIPVYDEKGNEVDQIEGGMPAYSKSNKRDDIKKINEFLTEKKFTSPITVQDLNDVTCDKLDKKEIVDLYNAALEKEYLGYPGDISYGMNSGAIGKFIDLENGGKLWVACLIEQARLGIVNIEYINEKGEYLSGLYESGKANDEQKQAQKQIDEIEKKIVEKQLIKVEDDVELIPNFTVMVNKLLTNTIKIENIK